MSTRGRVLSIKLRVNLFLTLDLEREKEMTKGKKVNLRVVMITL
jgi:hypothetical protein